MGFTEEEIHEQQLNKFYMKKVALGAIDTRKDFESYSVNIEIEEVSTKTNPFPNIIGGVKICVKGNHDELVKEIEKSVKRTINKYGKSST